MAASSSSQQSSQLERGRRWSGGVPADLAGEIMSRVSSSGDRVRLCATSASFKSSIIPAPSHPPWLMLPGSQGGQRSFYSCSERKLYHIHLPQIEGQHCVGSGKGWIITVNNLTGNLQLLEFLTGGDSTTTTTSLPSITTFSDVADTPVFDPSNGGRLKGYMRREPSPEVDDPHSYEPGALLLHLHHAQEFKLWKLEHIYSFYKNLNCDVVFHKGQFYTIVLPGWIMALDISSTPPRCTCLLLRPPPRICRKDVIRTSYLVESPDGAELMQVRRIVNVHKSPSYLTNTFIVFKCKLNSDGDSGQEEGNWVEVKCLDEWVLFLGDNLSLALSAKDFPELTPNSIYFTNGICMAWRDVNEFELGVFLLESGTIEPLLFPNNKSWLSHTTWPLPVWIPHAECFPLATQIAKVEDLTKRTEFNFDYKKHRRIKVGGIMKVRYLSSVKHKRMKKKKKYPHEQSIYGK